jgi:hypothetical protein
MRRCWQGTTAPVCSNPTVIGEGKASSPIASKLVRENRKAVVDQRRAAALAKCLTPCNRNFKTRIDRNSSTALASHAQPSRISGWRA